jgi:hypothetical protein
MAGRRVPALPKAGLSALVGRRITKRAERMTKLYCVHVYERPFQYPVRATDPDAAKRQVIDRFWSSDDEEIERVEVKRTCACGLDNDLDAKTCDDCGAPL